MLSFISIRNMLTLILFTFLSIEVSLLNGNSCTCCFPFPTQECQTPGFDIPSCADCTSSFCAQHVKGCQGDPCQAECNSKSSSTTTPMYSTSTETATTTSNGEATTQIGLFISSTSLSLLTFVQLNF